MKIIVQKFGGTSVSSDENRQHCLRHINSALDEGYHVVVVVSAMGRKGDPYATDTLLSLVKHNSLPPRERDLLLSTGELISASVFSDLLWSEQIPNTVLTGGQAGLVTNNTFSNAGIYSLKPTRILEELQKNHVVIVPGFQGVTEDGDITTLGRGGSDTSASALGVALNAAMVDIFTDVEGIMTADPRIVSDASILKTVTYNEVCNLAHFGAKVIHPRAVEFAMQGNIPLRVRSTFLDSPGTLITHQMDGHATESIEQERLIAGITQQAGISQIKVTTGLNKHHQLTIFNAMKEHEISVDFINVYPDGVVFTVSHAVIDQAKSLIESFGLEPIITEECAKVSLVGANIAGVPGVMASIIETLTLENIDILQSVDSHTTIWILVSEQHMNQAVSSLHRHFKENTMI